MPNPQSPIFTNADATESEGQSMVDFIAEELQRRILSGVLPIGTRLRQEALAEEFGASRTPIREALRQLQATTMIELLPHRGAIVRGPSPRDIREAYVVRGELEALAAALAADLISDHQMVRLDDAATGFRTAVEEFVVKAEPGQIICNDETEWIAANDLFHNVILEAADNTRLSEAITSIHRLVPRNLTWGPLSENSRLLADNAAQHEAVLSAIRARKPTLARAEMLKHIASSRELVARYYERASGTNAAETARR